MTQELIPQQPITPEPENSPIDLLPAPIAEPAATLPAELPENPAPQAKPWDPAVPPETVEETIPCYSANDAGNARRFLDACGDRVRFCAAEDQWYTFSGIQWNQTSETHIEQLAFHALEESYLKEAQYFKERDIFNSWTDTKFHTRIQLLKSFSQQVCRTMPESVLTFSIIPLKQLY